LCIELPETDGRSANHRVAAPLPSARQGSHACDSSGRSAFRSSSAA
jgi:hypothetical protein